MNNSKLYFARLRQDVIIPSKRKEDGAFDIYANFNEPYLIIQPHDTVMVPTGLISAFSSDYVAILKERGSTGSKGIGQRCGVIDSGYRGEWFIPLTNHNNKPLLIEKDKDRFFIDKEFNSVECKKDDFIIYPYEKAICQVIMVEVPKLSIEELTEEEILNFKSERGTGKLGSSKK